MGDPARFKPRAALAMLLAANALLALGPLWVRHAEVGPVAAGFWRMALALPVLALAARLWPGQGTVGVHGNVWWIAAGGVLLAAGIASWHLGIVRTTAANATLLGNSASLIFPAYGFVAARRWPTALQLGALVMAIAGTGLLLGRGAEVSSAHLAGDALCVGAGIFYTAFFVTADRLRATMAPLPLLALSTAATAPPLLAIAWLLGERVVPGSWGPLIGLAVTAQVIGQALLIAVFRSASPLVIGLSLLTQPIVGALTGFLAFGERIGALDLVGAGMIGLAIVLVQAGSANTSMRKV